MPQLNPPGVVYLLQSKAAADPMWTTVTPYAADDLAGYGEADAASDAYVAFDALVAAHPGGDIEYRILRALELRHEVRT